MTLYETLRERLARSQVTGLATFDGFQHAQRAAYWHYLTSQPLADAARLEHLRSFDQAMAQLRTEIAPSAYATGQQPGSQIPSATMHASGEPAAARPTAKAGSIRRDVLFLLLGALLGIPTGMFTNYIYDWAFPKDPTVFEQVGVQELSAPVDGFFFMYSKRDKSPRDGWIDVRYAMGTDTKKYTCTAKVSEPDLFEFVRFENTCRKVTFRFKDPAQMWAKWDQTISAVAISVTVTSDKGQLWEGSQGINFAYYRNL